MFLNYSTTESIEICFFFYDRISPASYIVAHSCFLVHLLRTLTSVRNKAGPLLYQSLNLNLSFRILVLGKLFWWMEMIGTESGHDNFAAERNIPEEL